MAAIVTGWIVVHNDAVALRDVLPGGCRWIQLSELRRRSAIAHAHHVVAQ